MMGLSRIFFLSGRKVHSWKIVYFQFCPLSISDNKKFISSQLEIYNRATVAIKGKDETEDLLTFIPFRKALEVGRNEMS